MADRFDSLVAAQMATIEAGEMGRLEAESIARRRAWFATTGRAVPGKATPRDGYDLFIRDYLGLGEDQVPVVSESPSSIAWLSRNPCPTLEACGRLGRDTRQVCRASTEKTAQALLSCLDPRLRFWRDYEEIRPHAAHCREGIVRMDFEALMDMALEEALQSLGEGNKGYGAVVAMGERVLACTHDTAGTEGDPSLHGEVNAIRAAVRVTGDPNLCGAVLFSTCEPCPMCASLAVWANVSAIVYGASIAETAALGRTRIHLQVQEVVDRSPANIEVIGGVQRERCLALYS